MQVHERQSCQPCLRAGTNAILSSKLESPVIHPRRAGSLLAGRRARRLFVSVLLLLFQ